MAKQFNLPGQTMRMLIEQELAVEGADKAGLIVSDDEIRDTILKTPYLQKDGRFSRETYDAVLRYNHLTTSQYESELKRGASIDKLEKLFTMASLQSASAKKKEEELKSKTLNVEFLRLDPEQMAQ